MELEKSGNGTFVIPTSFGCDTTKILNITDPGLELYLKKHSQYRWVRNNYFGSDSVNLVMADTNENGVLSLEIKKKATDSIRHESTNNFIVMKQKKIEKTTFGSKLDELDIGSSGPNGRFVWKETDGTITQSPDYVDSYKYEYRTKSNEFGKGDKYDVLDKSYPYQKRLLWVNKQLILPTNVAITIITNSYDVIHSWFIPGLGLKMDCVPGRSTHHTIYIEKQGYYYGQCAEVCGRRHHHMPIKILAVPYRYFVFW